MRSDRVHVFVRTGVWLLAASLAVTAAAAGELRTNAPVALASDTAEEALYRQGSAEYAAGQYAEALRTLERFVEQYPDSRRRATASRRRRCAIS